MLRFEPIYKSAPWGGRALAERFGRNALPLGPVGESWELASFGGHDNVVLNGPQRGKTLSSLWKAGELGGSAEGSFPFLLKWINATEFLSIQVHPDERVCAELGSGDPKSEAWLIVDRQPESVILAGHQAGLDGDTLRRAALDGTARNHLHELCPQPGDMVPIHPGTIHSIGPGYLLLEVQQPSSTTYRIYDWGRMGLDGKPRALHLERAVASTDFSRTGPPPIQREHISGPCFHMRALEPGDQTDADSLRVLVAHEGPVSLRFGQSTEELAFGDVVVAERLDGAVEIASGRCVWVSESTVNDRARLRPARG